MIGFVASFFSSGDINPGNLIDNVGMSRLIRVWVDVVYHVPVIMIDELG